MDIRGTSVLVVDHDLEIQLLISRVLATHEMQVTCASSVMEALRCIQRANFDLLILDLFLPSQDGISLLKFRMDYPVLRRLPVLVLGADQRFEAISQLKDLGVTQFVPKPIRVAELIQAVKRACDEQEQVVYELKEEDSARATAEVNAMVVGHSDEGVQIASTLKLGPETGVTVSMKEPDSTDCILFAGIVDPEAMIVKESLYHQSVRLTGIGTDHAKKFEQWRKGKGR